MGFHGNMLVKVTVTMRGRTMPLESIRDARIAGPFEAMASQVGATLESIRCPEHKKTAWNVRIVVDAQGSADLQYDSCCDKLGSLIRNALK